MVDPLLRLSGKEEFGAHRASPRYGSADMHLACRMQQVVFANHGIRTCFDNQLRDLRAADAELTSEAYAAGGNPPERPRCGTSLQLYRSHETLRSIRAAPLLTHPQVWATLRPWHYRSAALWFGSISSQEPPAWR